MYVHFLGDGRDTAPRSAAGYARELRDYIQKVGIGQVATIVGRYYAMDRDKRWDRVKIAVDGLVHGQGEAIAEDGDYVKAIETRYKKDETDEFLKPIIVNGDSGRIKGGCHHSSPTVFASTVWLWQQMMIPCSCSIIARTACARSAPYLDNWLNQWR